jgi:hypothetical protein
MTTRGDEIRAIVNDARWQRLRASMVGTWKHEPAENVKRLRTYLRGVKTARHLRFKRVYNYLTGSGFRIGVISHPAIDKLLAELRRIKSTGH